MLRTWAVGHGGLIKYISLTSNELKDVLHLMKNIFYKEDQISRAIGLYKSPEAINELEQLTLDFINDGVSVVAIEEKTGKVVVSLLNKIYVKECTPQGSFKGYEFSHPLARKFIEINTAIDESIDLFGLFKSDCYFETVFGTVKPEHRRNRVATNLQLASLQLAQFLKDGNDVRVSINNHLGQLTKPAGVVGISAYFNPKIMSDHLMFKTAKVINLSNSFTATPFLPVYVMYKFLK